MTNSKTFELITILSLLNKTKYLHVQETDKDAIVQHVHGPVDPGSQYYSKAVNDVIDYIAEKYPRFIEAAAGLLRNSLVDSRRYSSLVNIYKMNHELDSMVVAA